MKYIFIALDVDNIRKAKKQTKRNKQTTRSEYIPAQRKQ